MAAAAFSVSTPGCLSFVCFRASSAKRRKKTTCTRENWWNGRQRNFIRSRSYANLDLVPHRRAAAVPREYINFASSKNCSSIRFESHLFVSSFLLRYFVPSVTKMNKVYSVSSRTLLPACSSISWLKWYVSLGRVSSFSHSELPFSWYKSKVAGREKCRVVRGVLKFRYGYSVPLRTLDFLIMAQQKVEQSRVKQLRPTVSNLVR